MLRSGSSCFETHMLESPDPVSSRLSWFCRERMEALIGWNTKLAAIGKSDAPAFVKQLQKLPIYERFAKNLLQVRFIRLHPHTTLPAVAVLPALHSCRRYRGLHRRPAACQLRSVPDALRHAGRNSSSPVFRAHVPTAEICCLNSLLTLLLSATAAVLWQVHQPGLGGPGASRQRAAGVLSGECPLVGRPPVGR